jgi:hypothetical protein
MKKYKTIEMGRECCPLPDHTIDLKEYSGGDLVISPSRPGNITFCLGEKVVMELSNEKGIVFNRENFPDASPNEFADKVIEILENGFGVKIFEVGEE